MPRRPAPLRSHLRVLVLALVLAAGSDARAGNEAHPRTPVLWPDASCGWVVDRSTTPTIALDYAIPFEDTQLGPDELPDSRTHQFFALCRQRAPSELLPVWVTLDDVQRAGEVGLVDPATLPPEQVLDESSAWAGCFARITDEDQRRPITFAAADEPVPWSLAAVPRGVYQIAGYTFEPPYSLWSDRPGFVKIVDDLDDPAQDVPAAALAADEVWSGHGSLELCVDAIPPIEATFEWAPFAPQLDYRTLDTRTLAQRGSSELALDVPALDGPLEVVLRVRIVDALEREFIAYAASTLIFQPGPGVEPEPEPEPSDPSEPSGCSCSQRPTSGPLALATFVLLLGLRYASVRNRRASDVSRDRIAAPSDYEDVTQQRVTVAGRSESPNGA